MATAAVRASGAQNTDYIVITQAMLSAQQAELSAAPTTPTKVLVDYVGGVTQFYELDFVVSGNVLMWASMGLGTLLEVGDVLRVVYFTN